MPIGSLETVEIRQARRRGEQLHKAAPEFNFHCGHVVGEKRVRWRCVARQVATFVLRERFAYSYAVLARALGYKDHTGARYACVVVGEQCEDASFKARMKQLERKVFHAHRR